jgi:RNA polymerase sigma-70 factor (ECF subfamily)
VRPVNETDFQTLFLEAKQGSSTAEELLFERLSVRFRLFVGRKVRRAEDVEDVVQETLLAISRTYRDADIESEFAAWAYGVLRNKIADYNLTHKRRPESAVSFEAVEHVASVASASDSLVRRRLQDCLNRIKKTNRRFARILNLHYQGYTTDEICERLNLTPGNYYTILSRGRAMLLNCLMTGRLDDEPS